MAYLYSPEKWTSNPKLQVSIDATVTESFKQLHLELVLRGDLSENEDSQKIWDRVRQAGGGRGKSVKQVLAKWWFRCTRENAKNINVQFKKQIKKLINIWRQLLVLRFPVSIKAGWEFVFVSTVLVVSQVCCIMVNKEGEEEKEKLKLRRD